MTGTLRIKGSMSSEELEAVTADLADSLNENSPVPLATFVKATSQADTDGFTERGDATLLGTLVLAATNEHVLGLVVDSVRSILGPRRSDFEIEIDRPDGFHASLKGKNLKSDDKQALLDFIKSESKHAARHSDSQ